MPNNTELLQMLDRLWYYTSTCAGLPMNAPACYSLWQAVMYGSFVVGTAILAWSLWQIIDYRLKLAAALKAQAEREKVADADTMKQHTWAEVADAADVTDPHLAEKIKRELEQRRLKALTGR